MEGCILVATCFINGHGNNLLDCENCNLYKPYRKEVYTMEKPIIWKCEVCGTEISEKDFPVAFNKMKIHAESHRESYEEVRVMDIFNVKRDKNNLVMRAGT
jgi:hypothetical protein